ncbi:hypothetical protein QYF61_005032 [Mycteria americana]|uniref:Uncharacterized protein n=1 Tax=Mycteria americana TaxID=33587 RepID=A0AAN7PGZ1_MYCAM|nr:hypothetical protein QYF61_005032 [Mycteria americana]
MSSVKGHQDGWGLVYLSSEKRLRELGLLSPRIDSFEGSRAAACPRVNSAPFKEPKEEKEMGTTQNDTPSDTSQNYVKEQLSGIQNHMD